MDDWDRQTALEMMAVASSCSTMPEGLREFVDHALRERADAQAHRLERLDNPEASPAFLGAGKPAY
jgi:hypothetical protein